MTADIDLNFFQEKLQLYLLRGIERIFCRREIVKYCKYL